MRDKIQTIPTNKGSLQGRRGWNIFEEWYCLTPPPLSLSLPLALPHTHTHTHTPPPSLPLSLLSPLLSLHAPQPSSALPSRGSSGQGEKARDVRRIKGGDGGGGGGKRGGQNNQANTCVRVVSLCTCMVFSEW